MQYDHKRRNKTVQPVPRKEFTARMILLTSTNIKHLTCANAARSSSARLAAADCESKQKAQQVSAGAVLFQTPSSHVAGSYPGWATSSKKEKMNFPKHCRIGYVTSVNL